MRNGLPTIPHGLLGLLRKRRIVSNWQVLCQWKMLKAARSDLATSAD